MLKFQRGRGAGALPPKPAFRGHRSSRLDEAEAYSVSKIGDEVKVIRKSELFGPQEIDRDEDKGSEGYQDARKSSSKSKDSKSKDNRGHA